MAGAFRDPVAAIAVDFVVVGACIHAQTLAEALDSDLVWFPGGASTWSAYAMNTHDALDAVRSGVIGPG
jgi:hypothetical protein